MEKKRVLIDVDGVLADFVAEYLNVVYLVTERPYTHDDVTEFDLKRALKLSDTEAAAAAAEVSTSGFASRLQPLYGAVDGIRALSAIADVYIVTSPWNSNPTWCHEREKWLARHFGIHHSKVLHGSAKHCVTGDVFIDDRGESVIAWNAAHPGRTAILWEQPWNARAEWAGVRTNDWYRVVRLVQS